MDETERYMSTDSEYWHRLGSAAFDAEDGIDVDALAEEWETKYFGQFNKGKHARLGPKPRGQRLEVWIQPEASVMPLPMMAPLATASSTTAASQPPAAPPKFAASKAYAVARRVSEQFFASGKVTVSRLPDADIQLLVGAFDHMMYLFCSPERHFRSRYGGQHDAHPHLAFGQPVPSYFANVGGQSIFYRKVLSMAGLRNLLSFGPVIYTQLEQTHFEGNPSKYAPDKGLNLMRTMTGNVVDLDTTVLRCTDRVTLDVINMSNAHKGLPTFSSTQAFSESALAAEIAVNCARPLLEDFIAKFRLSEQQAIARNVHPSQLSQSIPVANDNSTRGHCPLWHYVNAGQDSFHCNVPTMEDVVGALLRAPFACVEQYAALHMMYSGRELDVQIDDFFESCVVDSCFNMKWKAIEEYGDSLRRRGTIVDVLQQLQAAHQKVFTGDFFDADNEQHDAEVREMMKLVHSESKVGRDKNGRVRSITEDDVRRWVDGNARNERVEI